MLFGDKIRELRDEQGLLQRQLAEALDIETSCSVRLDVKTDEPNESK